MTIDPRLHQQIHAHPYPLLFSTINGAHLYGFPSSDSAYELCGVHRLPLEQVVGLNPGEETVERKGTHDGVAIDLTTHDARKFFELMLNNDGCVLEQLLSPLVVHTTQEHEELKAIAGDCITRNHAQHYLSIAAGQWSRFAGDDPPRLMPLLCTYRVLLTGIHLMHAGQFEANLVRLNETFELPYIPDLIARKVGGAEQETLDPTEAEFHEREYEQLTAALRRAFESSRLPESPGGAAALHDLLVRVRLGSRGFA